MTSQIWLAVPWMLCSPMRAPMFLHYGQAKKKYVQVHTSTYTAHNKALRQQIQDVSLASTLFSISYS